MVGELLKQAERYIQEGVHPRVLGEGFEVAKAGALKVSGRFRLGSCGERGFEIPAWASVGVEHDRRCLAPGGAQRFRPFVHTDADWTTSVIHSFSSHSRGHRQSTALRSSMLRTHHWRPSSTPNLRLSCQRTLWTQYLRSDLPAGLQSFLLRPRLMVRAKACQIGRSVTLSICTWLRS